jgi:putative PEP-CTERM system TPR-repeat lipoprotein
MRRARRGVWWLALLAVVTALAAVPAARADSDDLFEQAQRAEADGDLRAAQIHLKNLLQRDPSHVEARIALGRLHLLQRNPQAAEKEFKVALRLGGEDDRVLLGLAQAYLMAGRVEALIDELTVPDDASPGFRARALALRGQAFYLLRRPDEAETAFEEALTLDSASGEAHAGLARLAVQRGDLEQAAVRVQRGLDAAPKHAELWVIKGELERMGGHPKEALASFEAALERDDRQVGAWLGKAVVLIGQGDLDGAEAAVKRVAALSPRHPSGGYLRALIAFRRGDLEAAATNLQGVLRAIPAHLPSHLLAGTVGYAQGNLEQALDHLERYVGQVPDQLPARKLLAAAQIKAGELDAAIETLEQGRAQAPDDVQTLALLGSAYLKKGEHQRGSALLEAAVEQAPDVAAIRTQLALGLLAGGDTEAALSELETAVDLGLPQAEFFLVLALLREGRPEEALKAARALGEKLPDSPVPQNLMGAARLAQGDEQGARVAFEEAVRRDPEGAAARLNLARIALREGQHEAAQRQLDAILEGHPDHEGALMELASLATAQERLADALGYLERAQEAHPGSLRSALALARAYLSRGDALKAVGVLRQASGGHPDQPAVLELMAKAQAATGELGAALASARRLVNLRPQSAAAQYLLGRILVAREDAAGAAQAFGEAVRLAPRFAEALAALAGVRLASGESDAALEAAERLQALRPEAALGWRLAGDALFQGEAFAAAAARYREGLERQPGTDLVVRLYRAMVRAGDAAGGRQALRDWLGAHPEDTAVALLLADAALVEGDERAAASHYEQVLEAQPDNVVALNNAAWLYLESDPTHAMALAERAYRLAPENPNVLDTYGWSLVKGGQAGRGLVLLQEAVGRAPQAGEIRYHLVEGLRQAGRREEARAELERLLADGLDFPQRAEAQALHERWEAAGQR